MRRPWLHFALAGALLFGAERWRSASPEAAARETIVVAGNGAAAIDDEVLFREALAHGFAERDEAVRERLVRVGRFLGLAAGGDDAAVEREVRGLGLERSDPVIRRYLTALMRLAAANPEPRDMPTEAALRAYYERHAARYAAPPRLRLTHVYLSAEGRGARLDADAAELLARLRARAVPPAGTAGLGDAFARGATAVLSEPQIDRMFGPGFAAGLVAQPDRTWVGPLRSSYGLHLVWIDERVAAAPPPLETVRGRVLHEMLNEVREARLRDTLRTLRARYDIRLAASSG